MDENEHETKTVWRFGPQWPGRRCGAKTRSGSPCQKPALFGKTRCQLHGGRAGAPRGERNGNYRHGRYTKQEQERKRDTERRLEDLYQLGMKWGIFRQE